MTRTRPRFDQVKKTWNPDDQRSAAEVAAADISAEQQQDHYASLLSQIKRIIHGSDVGNWYDDPETIFARVATLKALSSGGTGGFDSDLILVETIDQYHHELMVESGNVMIDA